MNLLGGLFAIVFIGLMAMVSLIHYGTLKLAFKLDQIQQRLDRMDDECSEANMANSLLHQPVNN